MNEMKSPRAGPGIEEAVGKCLLIKFGRSVQPRPAPVSHRLIYSPTALRMAPGHGALPAPAKLLERSVFTRWLPCSPPMSSPTHCFLTSAPSSGSREGNDFSGASPPTRLWRTDTWTHRHTLRRHIWSSSYMPCGSDSLLLTDAPSPLSGDVLESPAPGLCPS